MSEATESLERLLRVEQQKLQRGLVAPNTVIGYGYAWSIFARWCETMERTSLPATTETVCLFLTDQLTTGKTVATTLHRTSAISFTHRSKDFETPVTDEVWELLRGARRLRNEEPRRVRPLTVPHLKKILAILKKKKSPLSVRNRAILLVGRRENLAALRAEDVEFCEKGLRLRIRKEKQDRVGQVRYIGIPYGSRSYTCPVRVLKEWMKIRGPSTGPLFTRVPCDGKEISGEAICKMIKRCVRMIGLDPKEFGGHSTRAGLVTAA